MAVNKEGGFTFSLLGSPPGSDSEEEEEEVNEMQSLLDSEEIPAGATGLPFSDAIGPIHQGSPRAFPTSGASGSQNGPSHGLTTDPRSGMTEFPDVHVVNMPTSSPPQASHNSHVHQNLRRSDPAYTFSSPLIVDSQMEENVKCLVSSGIFFAIVVAVFVIMFVMNPMM